MKEKQVREATLAVAERISKSKAAPASSQALPSPTAEPTIHRPSAAAGPEERMLQEPSIAEKENNRKNNQQLLRSASNPRTTDCGGNSR